MKTISVSALALLAFLAIPATAGESVLQPLSAVAKHLDEGFVSLLEGKTPSEAFKPWKSVGGAEEVEKLRAAMKEAGVASGVSGSVELEVYLKKAGKTVYRIRTLVWTGGGDPCFVAFEGDPQTEEPSVTVHPSEAFIGGSQPFADAAKALVAALQGDGWKTLPWGDAKALTTAISFEGAVQGMLKMMEEGKAAAPGVAAAVAKLQSDAASVRIDDQVFLVRDAAGKAVGVVTGSFELGDEGAISYELGKLKPFPK